MTWQRRGFRLAAGGVAGEVSDEPPGPQPLLVGDVTDALAFEDGPVGRVAGLPAEGLEGVCPGIAAVPVSSRERSARR
jgi:hypothetical protein